LAPIAQRTEHRSSDLSVAMKKVKLALKRLKHIIIGKHVLKLKFLVDLNY